MAADKLAEKLETVVDAPDGDEGGSRKSSTEKAVARQLPNYE